MIKKCAYCGREFKTARSGRNKYCSEPCARNALNDLKRAKRAELAKNSICGICGKEFRKTNNNQKYCCKSCARSAKRKRLTTMRLKDRRLRDYKTPKKINCSTVDDGYLRLAESILEIERITYEVALRSKNWRRIAMIEKDLRSGYYDALWMGVVDAEDYIHTMRRKYGIESDDTGSEIWR